MKNHTVERLAVNLLYNLFYQRHPISSMVFGTNAVIVKPAQSVAPMIVVAILNHYGYEQLKVRLEMR